VEEMSLLFVENVPDVVHVSCNIRCNLNYIHSGSKKMSINK
jgi:hypothetical protein